MLGNFPLVNRDQLSRFRRLSTPSLLLFLLGLCRYHFGEVFLWPKTLLTGVQYVEKGRGDPEERESSLDHFPWSCSSAPPPPPLSSQGHSNSMLVSISLILSLGFSKLRVEEGIVIPCLVPSVLLVLVVVVVRPQPPPDVGSRLLHRVQPGVPRHGGRVVAVLGDQAVEPLALARRLVPDVFLGGQVGLLLEQVDDPRPFLSATASVFVVFVVLVVVFEIVERVVERVLPAEDLDDLAVGVTLDFHGPDGAAVPARGRDGQGVLHWRCDRRSFGGGGGGREEVLFDAAGRLAEFGRQAQAAVVLRQRLVLVPGLGDEAVAARVEGLLGLLGLFDGRARGPPLALLEIAAHCVFFFLGEGGKVGGVCGAFAFSVWRLLLGMGFKGMPVVSSRLICFVFLVVFLFWRLNVLLLTTSQSTRNFGDKHSECYRYRHCYLISFCYRRLRFI